MFTPMAVWWYDNPFNFKIRIPLIVVYDLIERVNVFCVLFRLGSSMLGKGLII